MKALTLALDWTPNINHIGFFIAQEKGYYEKHGTSLEIVDPSIDDYQVTPAKKVELGVADFALCPTESIISYRTKEKPFPLIAIAAVLQEDQSAIVVKGDHGIHSPKDLDGKRYGSYQARYEDEIVKQMIRNAGGKGDFEIDYPNKFGIWDTVLNGSFDATWIFLNWEGVEAEALDTTLTYFKMKDYQVPYPYSPVIAASEESIKQNEAVYAQFLSATKEGYLYCQQHPEEAIDVFQQYVPEKDKGIDLKKALSLSMVSFGNEQQWGKFDADVVGAFVDWIYDKNLEEKLVTASEIVTNGLIK